MSFSTCKKPPNNSICFLCISFTSLRRCSSCAAFSFLYSSKHKTISSVLFLLRFSFGVPLSSCALTLFFTGSRQVYTGCRRSKRIIWTRRGVVFVFFSGLHALRISFSSATWCGYRMNCRTIAVNIGELIKKGAFSSVASCSVVAIDGFPVSGR